MREMKTNRFKDIEACPPDLWWAGMQGESRGGTAVRGFISYPKRSEEKCKASNREP